MINFFKIKGYELNFGLSVLVRRVFFILMKMF